MKTFNKYNLDLFRQLRSKITLETCKSLIFCFLISLSLTSDVTAENNSFIDDCIWNSQDQSEVISRKFKQQKFITGLTIPIISEGEFKLFQNDRIEWLTKSPFNSKIIVSKDGIQILSQLDEGFASNKSENFDNTYFKELGSILVTLHSTRRNQESYEKLQKQFALNCQVTETGKKLMIARPTDFRLKRIIKQIEISGVNDPTEIKVIDTRGDLTIVNLE